ncbi:MAG: uroporphyrinogen-III synthase, partial [bacterium]|nr:uroporphyrinogen-III synthase [bacterium]
MNKNEFNGLRVASFESRRAAEMKNLIEKMGGQPLVSPSMREVPLDDQEPAIDFAHRLITGDIAMAIFLTGVGFKTLLSAVEKRVDRERFLNGLRDIVTVCRGPKPVAAMREVDLKPTLRVPEPNTWRELLATLDEWGSINQLNVGLQEYGRTNPSLTAGLEARGANVVSVSVYQWALPEDRGPLEANIDRMIAGEVDVAMFTSANQITNLLTTAEEKGVASELREAMRQIVIASVGPTTSEHLRSEDLPVDVEPVHPKMGPL